MHKHKHRRIVIEGWMEEHIAEIASDNGQSFSDALIDLLMVGIGVNKAMESETYDDFTADQLLALRMVQVVLNERMPEEDFDGLESERTEH